MKPERDIAAALVDASQEVLGRLRAAGTGSPLLDADQFPFARAFEQRSSLICREAIDLLDGLGGARNSSDLSEVSVGVAGAWRVVPLVDRRGEFPYLSMMPTTRRLLASVPGLRAADLAQLDAGSAIDVHRGHNIGVVRAHLTLVEPFGREPCQLEFPDCGIVQPWRLNEMFVFDDLEYHRAINGRGGDRLILHLELDRPGGIFFRSANQVAQILYRFHPVQRGVRARSEDAYSL